MASIKKRTWKTSKGKGEGFVLAYTDRNGNRHKEQFSRRDEAEERKAQVMTEVSKGQFRPQAKTLTVADAIDAYVDHLRNRNEERGVTEMYFKNAKGQLENYAVPVIGGIKLGNLTPLDLSNLVRHLKSDAVGVRGKSPGVVTIRRVMGELSRCLGYAVSQNMVSHNVAKGMPPITAGRDSGNDRVVPPSKAEFAALLKAADELYDPSSNQPNTLSLRIRFAARTGLRASEQWALRWEAVNLKTRILTVAARVDAYAGVERVTKTRAGRREVRLSAAMVTDLQAWRDSSPFSGEQDFVFPTTTGSHINHANFTKRHFNKVLAKSGVDVGWHSLRHYAISTWIEAGLEPKAVQTIAGHSSYQITMNRYGHLFPQERHGDIMDAIDG